MTKRMKAHEMHVPLVGFTHRATAQQRRKMAAQVPLRAELRREPQNAHDGNAIAIYLLDKPYRNMHIGYVRRQVAAILADRLDTAKYIPAVVEVVELDPESGLGDVRVKYTKRK